MPSFLITLFCLTASTYALPSSSLTKRAPIPQYHCGSKPLESSDISAAFTILRSRSTGGQYFLDAHKSASAGSGGAQFYICNNAGSKRFFTLDQKALDTAMTYFNDKCGQNSF